MEIRTEAGGAAAPTTHAGGRATSADDRVQTRPLLSVLLSRPEIGSLIGAIALFVLFLVVAPTLRSGAALLTVLYSSSTIGIMAVSVALLMIGGEFDLSAGVAVTTASLTASMVAYQLHLNVWVGVLAALVLALAVGLFNGWLLVRTGLPSFIITLGSFFMLTGLNLGVTKVITGGVSSPTISDMDGFSSAKAFFDYTLPLGNGVRVPVIFWIVLVVVATWILLRTRIGNWIFAAGGDPAAARAVGVPVKATKIGLFMAVGFTAWLLGMHNLFAYSNAQSGNGVGNELFYIIAAVVGGCLMTGGYGSAIGAAIGALIYGVVTNGIVYAGWQADWNKLFLGAMLVLATIVNLVVKNQAAKR
ncbi:ABC transporter permease [Kineococcus rhizosphaerae]|uniref:Xylose transport system permease protein XylH n=1 Tax=Kineococcus rhizosphaerae TaxID=559628 RepID=A0A2T0R608_9ACTN|nr:ABC transporter permease [Kineococcus rhizosphaerae]PRY16606.1 monosaccharide ABC transporter membrane protein (CUT2 family) [Kineococcus rhizosphaerae]